MTPTAIAAFACALLAVTMVAGTLVGRGAARRRRARADAEENPGSGLVQGATFALLGLLLAFAFSQAYGRFQQRRELIVAEANAIGTLRLRLDLLSAAERAAARTELREYVERRTEAWRQPDATAQQAQAVTRGNELQEMLWARLVAATASAEHSSLRMLLLPALNELIDLSSERMSYIHAHPPLAITGLLFAVALLCSVMSGLAMGAPSKLPSFHVLAFALVSAGTIYLIQDLEYARFGWINLEASHELLVEQISTLR